MKQLTTIVGVLGLVGLCLAVPRVPTATTLPARPETPRAVDPTAERMCWVRAGKLLTARDANGLDVRGVPKVSAFGETTRSGVYTLILRGPDGADVVLDRLRLDLNPGWRAKWSVRFSAQMMPDPNVPKVVRP